MRRKITTEAISAFELGIPFKKSNTEVVREGTIYYLKLFGNKIAARYEDGRTWISNAGWDSNTTKERLNGFQFVRINQKKGEWYLNGKLWDGSPTYIDTTW
jgi:hypothetical protein